MKKIFGSLRKKEETSPPPNPATSGSLRRGVLGGGGAGPAPAATAAPAKAADPPPALQKSNMDAYLEPAEPPKKSPRESARASAAATTDAAAPALPPKDGVKNAVARFSQVEQPSRSSSSSKLGGATSNRQSTKAGETGSTVAPAASANKTVAPVPVPAMTMNSARGSTTASAVEGNNNVPLSRSSAAALGSGGGTSRLSQNQLPVASAPKATTAASAPAVPAKAPATSPNGGLSPALSRVNPAPASPQLSRVSAAVVPETPTSEDLEDSDSARTPLRDPPAKDLATQRDTPLSTKLMAADPRVGRVIKIPNKKRDSFYASNKFRLSEATLRDETEELSRFQSSRIEEALPGQVYRAFSDLRDVAREANTEMLTPQFVVIGLCGHGKSSVVEGLLGYPILHTDFEVPARRPIHVSMQNNPKFSEPRFTLMPDLSLGIRKRQAFSDVREVRQEVKLRLGKTKDILKTAIHILIEHAEAVNFDIFECPGLSPFNREDAAISLVTELARPVHRTLVVVEECIEWSSVNSVLMQTVLELDPNLARTIFVHSKFNTMLQGMYNSVDVSQYFSGIVRMHAPESSFWVTSLSAKCRAACATPEQFNLRLAQARSRDLVELSYLQFDKKFEPFIGIGRLRAYLLQFVVSRIRACVPQIFYALQASEDETSLQLRELSAPAASSPSLALDAGQARTAGMGYVSGFLDFLEHSIAGTLEASPAHFGETSEEEGLLLLPSSGEGAKEAEQCQVEARLVGGQKFQRLLMELRCAINALDFDSVLPAADYPDPAHATNDENNILAASYAHQAMAKSILPLFTSACDRGEHIMFDMFTVYDRGYDVSAAEEDEAAASEQFLLANAPYFRNLMRDKYRLLLQRRRGELEKRLREEILPAETLRWALVSFADMYAPPKAKDARAAASVALHSDESSTPRLQRLEQDKFKGLSQEARAELERVQREQVAKLKKPRAVARRIFAVQRGRVAAGVSLLFFRHLLDVGAAVWEELHATVSGLKEGELEKLFDLDAAVERENRARTRLTHLLELLQETKKTYHHASLTFLDLVSPVPSLVV